MTQIRFGTCSWKYDSWKGVIYPVSGKFNYLKEYSRHFNTLEIDQWFWSLFDKVVLPLPEVVKNYVESVPDDFLFTIKVPNSLTLTHYYKSSSKNPYFLSNDLFEQFLSSIEPLIPKTGSLIFQFEYMKKDKMNSVGEFMDVLRRFAEGLPPGIPPISIETRNPYYINRNWFSFLSSLDFSHVFLEGYFMQPITEIYSKYKECVKGFPLIRLHGPDRGIIEEQTGKEWNRILVDRMTELKAVAELIEDLQKRVDVIFVNVNNHYEGSAPLTIKRLQEAGGFKNLD